MSVATRTPSSPTAASFPRTADAGRPGTDSPAVPLPASALVEIGKGIAASPLWAQHASHGPDRRPVRLLATEQYEVWVLGWTTGQSVELHDHGEAEGAIVVTEGTLTEILSSGPIDDSTRLTLGAGAVRSIPAGVVHDVLNLHPEPATSIHVYSPPLSSMTFYDPIDGRAVRTEVIEPEEPALDPRSSATALHPSRLAGA